MAPVGHVLGSQWGVLEPWQTAKTVAGQVQELSDQIDGWASAPVTLIGHSWGAWLALLFAAAHPEQVRRLILIGCAPLTDRHADEVDRRRRQRLSPAQRKEFEERLRQLKDESSRPKSSVLRRVGELAEVADSYELLPHPSPRTVPDARTFQTVWKEAVTLRDSGALVRALRHVRVPILVIHGEADPHSARGVVEPLRHAAGELRVVLLPRCGHEPWWERYAKDRFFDELRAELVRAEEPSPAELKPPLRG
jgi:pimeloyl-ACP methyl ester carboxylesterase